MKPDMNDLTLLREAIRLAREHSEGGEGGPFGALVVRDGEIVGRGWNQVVMTHDPTAHAEILAIRAAARELGTHLLDACTIYCSCEPCPMCLSAIYWARISRVVYAAEGADARSAGFDDDLIARELKSEWEGRTLESMQALTDEGRQVLNAWTRNPNRKEY